MQLSQFINAEDANVFPFAHNAPNMQPFALTLQCLCPINFGRTESLDLFLVRVVWHTNDDMYMEQHECLRKAKSAHASFFLLFRRSLPMPFVLCGHAID